MTVTDLFHHRQKPVDDTPPREYWVDRRLVVASLDDTCSHGVSLEDSCETCQIEVWHTFAIPIDEQ